MFKLAMLIPAVAVLLASGFALLAQSEPAHAANVCGSREIWINDVAYGTAGGGVYWDPLSSQVWTPEKGWHYFAPNTARPSPQPLWVNQLDYGSVGGGFYWDPVSGQVWTAEQGWHIHGEHGCGATTWLGFVGGLTHASHSSGRGASDGDSSEPAISADGRFIAFTSHATDLVDGDTNGVSDIFVTDLTTGTVERVSVASDGGQGLGASYRPSISHDGRYVVFLSVAENLAPDGNGTADPFMYDRTTGTTVNLRGRLRGVAPAFWAWMEPSGRFVITGYHTDAPGFTRQAEVFLWDRNLGDYPSGPSYPPLSVPGTDNAADLPCIKAFVSSDGLTRALNSGGVCGTVDQLSAVFLSTRPALDTPPAQRTTLLAPGNLPLDGHAVVEGLSSDGRYVLVRTKATNLGNGGDGSWQTSRYDRSDGTWLLASVSGAGTLANAATNAASISADGRYVAFSSSATNLAPDASTSRERIFIRDMVENSTRMVSVGWEGEDPDAPSSQPSVTMPLIGGDAPRVAFVSRASNLFPGADGTMASVFVRDLRLRVPGWTLTYACVDQGNFYGWTVAFYFAGPARGVVRWTPGWGRSSPETRPVLEVSYNIPPGQDSWWWGTKESAADDTLIEFFDSSGVLKRSLLLPAGTCIDGQS